MPTTRKPQPGRALAAVVLSVFAVAAAQVVDSEARTATPTSGCTGPYGWPVKPFDQAHPIRGAFGDPRTVFRGRNSQRTVAAGAGVFSFHQGVDISAPDGSPVYAVADGSVTRARGGRVTVSCGNGRSFQYWHIEPAVRTGQRAVTGRTVIGYIQPKREHVHLTHVESGRAVNPLGAGRLTPYRDATTPRVTEITLRHDGGAVSSASRVSGRTFFYARAADTPALPVPGRWHGFPVTPAVVTWRIERTSGRVVVANHTPRDVRRIVPKNDRFWTTFARGTHQNWPVFSDGKARGVRGRFVFQLTPTGFDTTDLADGDYVLVVSVADTAGNHSNHSLDFTIDNGSH